MNGRNGNLKQLQQTTARCFMHSGICIIHTRLKYNKTPRENARNPSPVKMRFDCFQ